MQERVAFGKLTTPSLGHIVEGRVIEHRAKVLGYRYSKRKAVFSNKSKAANPVLVTPQAIANLQREFLQHGSDVGIDALAFTVPNPSQIQIEEVYQVKNYPKTQSDWSDLIKKLKKGLANWNGGFESVGLTVDWTHAAIEFWIFTDEEKYESQIAEIEKADILLPSNHGKTNITWVGNDRWVKEGLPTELQKVVQNAKWPFYPVDL